MLKLFFTMRVEISDLFAQSIQDFQILMVRVKNVRLDSNTKVDDRIEVAQYNTTTHGK